MLWLICFDISDNKARRRVVKIIEGYGFRIQYSVFECLVSRKQIRLIQHNIGKLIAESDRVLYYPICGKDILHRYAEMDGFVHWPAPLYHIDDS